jgi:hypothetical protein
MYTLNILSQFVSCLFIFLMMSFDEKKTLISYNLVY